MDKDLNELIIVEDVLELVEGEDTFRSDGYSNVKVTKNGEVVCKRLPIKSSGISEIIDSFNDNAPEPPKVNELVTPESEIGKQLGLKKKTWVKIPDTTDEKYRKELEEHNSNMGIAILCHGIAAKIKDKEGNIIDDQSKKITILRKMGLSGEQFSQIVMDITSLTKWNEEEYEDFLE